MNEPIDPQLETLAAQYWAALNTSFAIVSRSQFLLMDMTSRFGGEAVDAVMTPYFEKERDATKRDQWKKIVAFYAEFGLAPSPEHPGRPKDISGDDSPSP